MHIKHSLTALGVLFALCTACVDPEYNLGNMINESVVLRNVEVPVGNFETVTLRTILKAPDATMIEFLPGSYNLSGSATLSGVNLRFDEKLYFESAELHTVILNTLPLDLHLGVQCLDAEGMPCPDVKIDILAERNPMIASGKKGAPSSNPIVLRLECQDGLMTLEQLRLVFSGKTGEGFENEAPQMDEGITLTQAVLKVPEGFHIR